jgi:hypothetical protein
MVDFAALLKKSQEKKRDQAEEKVAAAAQPVTPESTDREGVGAGVPREVPSVKPRNPFARAADSTVVADGSSSAGSTQAQPAKPLREETLKDSAPPAPAPVKTAPKLAGLKFATPPASTSPANTKPVTQIDSLDDLDNIDLSGIEAIGDEDAPRSQFADETPAQAPTRELPEGLDKQARAFIDLIDGVYGMLHDPEFLGQVIRNIMIELKENPQYVKHICDDDVRVWIRTMRDSMGLARVKKLESKAKRGSGGASKAKSSKVDDDMMSDLASLGLDL